MAESPSWLLLWSYAGSLWESLAAGGFLHQRFPRWGPDYIHFCSSACNSIAAMTYFWEILEERCCRVGDNLATNPGRKDSTELCGGGAARVAVNQTGSSWSWWNGTGASTCPLSPASPIINCIHLPPHKAGNNGKPVRSWNLSSQCLIFIYV